MSLHAFEPNFCCTIFLSMGSHVLLIFPFLVSSGLSTSDGVGSIDESVTHSCPPYLYQIVGRS